MVDKSRPEAVRCRRAHWNTLINPYGACFLSSAASATSATPLPLPRRGVREGRRAVCLKRFVAPLKGTDTTRGPRADCSRAQTMCKSLVCKWKKMHVEKKSGAKETERERERERGGLDVRFLSRSLVSPVEDSSSSNKYCQPFFDVYVVVQWNENLHLPRQSEIDIETRYYRDKYLGNIWFGEGKFKKISIVSSSLIPILQLLLQLKTN